MRLFIAINFDDEVKKYLKSVQADVKNISSGGNFSHEENLHLTLVFLGEVAPGRVNQIEQAMNSVHSLPFELVMGGVGSFKRGTGDIIWVGVKPNKILADIYKQLCNSLNNSGFVIESCDYKPHLTLAREVVLTDSIKSVSAPNIATTVNKISLMKSERLGGKLVYTEIYAKELK